MNRRGFTLVELLIVIVVIAIIAAISVVAYNGIQTRATTTLVKDGLATKTKMLELDKVDRGSYVGDLSQLTASDDGRVLYEYTLSGNADTQEYCMTGVSGRVSLHVLSSARNQVINGSCEDHSDPNAAPPEIAYMSKHHFSEPGSSAGALVSATINFDLQPSDTVLVLYAARQTALVKSLKIGTTDMTKSYERIFGLGSLKTMLYRGTGFSGPQTLAGTYCFSTASCYNGGTIESDYIVYVIRGKRNPSISYTETGYATIAKGASVTPEAQSVRRHDIMLMTALIYGNNMPAFEDESSPGATWVFDGQQTGALTRPGGGQGMTAYRALIEVDGTSTKRMTASTSGVTYGGATLFVIR